MVKKDLDGASVWKIGKNALNHTCLEKIEKEHLQMKKEKLANLNNWKPLTFKFE